MSLLATVLRLASATALLGQAWQHLFWTGAWWELFWNQGWLEGPLQALGVSWESWASSATVEGAVIGFTRAVGLLFAVAGVASLCRVRSQRGQALVGGLLLTSGALLGLHSALRFVEHHHQWGQLMELTCRWSAPLLLWSHLKGAQGDHATHNARLAGPLALSVALTFLGHGLYAVGFYETPGHFITMTMTIVPLSQEGAVTFLFVAGVLDFIVAGVLTAGLASRMLDARKLNAPRVGRAAIVIAAAWAALWGAATAIARPASGIDPAFLLSSLSSSVHQMVIRFPHFLLPIGLLVITSRLPSNPLLPMKLRFSPRIVGPLVLLLALTLAPTAAAETARYRLSWRDNPSTTGVIGWDQTSGESAVVYYGTTDHGTAWEQYERSEPVSASNDERGMNNRFARLTELQPDTAYFFVIRDANSISPRMWFRTAPATPQPFALVVGGDTRNNRTPRQNGNIVVSKLRPLAVMLGGDFTDRNSDTEWREWFDDWQLTRSNDGRMYPMIAAQGNHDSAAAIHRLWDTPTDTNYYALSVGGDLARLYTLNSEIPEGGSQASWLKSDLSNHPCALFRVAQYHKPMRPHNSGKSEGYDEYNAWADIFYDEGMDLVVECDSHTVKRTWPLAPSSEGDEGFARDDARGTVYIGEGCWGAPLRSSDDTKTWTRDNGRFNQVNWVQVHLDRLEIRTVELDHIAGAASVSDSSPFTVPAGLPLWEPSNGQVVEVAARTRPQDCSPLSGTGGAQGSGGSPSSGGQLGSGGEPSSGGQSSSGGDPSDPATGDDQTPTHTGATSAAPGSEHDQVVSTPPPGERPVDPSDQGSHRLEGSVGCNLSPNPPGLPVTWLPVTIGGWYLVRRRKRQNSKSNSTSPVTPT